MPSITVKLTKAQQEKIELYLVDQGVCDLCEGAPPSAARFSLIMQPFVAVSDESKSTDGTCQVVKVCEVCSAQIQAIISKCKGAFAGEALHESEEEE